MIKTFDDLWNKLQLEFNKTNEEIANVNNKIGKEIANVNNKIDKEIANVNDKMDKGFASVNDKIDKEIANVNNKMEEGFASVNDKITDIANKIDVITNVNLAQILNEQTRTKNELSKKIDEYIVKNEFEHKKLDYKLAEIEMKYGYTSH